MSVEENLDGRKAQRDIVLSDEAFRALERAGTATVHEASGGEGLIDCEWIQVIPGSRACGPARIAYCDQDDNRGAHEVMNHLEPGDVLVLTMPEPTPVALVGELIAVQAQYRGAVAVLVDAAVRDVEELRSIGLPVWARFVRVRGTTKKRTLGIDVPVSIAGTTIRPGDAVLLDTDGVVVVPVERVEEVIAASQARTEKEIRNRQQFEAGETSWEVYGYAT